MLAVSFSLWHSLLYICPYGILCGEVIMPRDELPQNSAHASDQMSKTPTATGKSDQYWDEEESRLKQYRVIKLIGRGHFGKVFLTEYKPTGEIRCLKLVVYKGMQERQKCQLVAEVNVMRNLRHPNIVRYYERVISQRTQSLYIVMEYCDAGDLAATMANTNKLFNRVQEDVIIDVAAQLLSALSYCHNTATGPSGRRVLHRDLKPQNIFLCRRRDDDAIYGPSSKFIAKLGDFGLSRHLGPDSFAHSCVGTPYYWSPELLKDGYKTYNEKSDMWALGCLLYEMATGKSPFYNMCTMQMLRYAVLKGPKLPIKCLSNELNHFIACLLKFQPSERPDALQCQGYAIMRNTLHFSSPKGFNPNEKGCGEVNQEASEVVEPVASNHAAESAISKDENLCVNTSDSHRTRPSDGLVLNKSPRSICLPNGDGLSKNACESSKRHFSGLSYRHRRNAGDSLPVKTCLQKPEQPNGVEITECSPFQAESVVAKPLKRWSDCRTVTPDTGENDTEKVKKEADSRTRHSISTLPDQGFSNLTSMNMHPTSSIYSNQKQSGIMQTDGTNVRFKSPKQFQSSNQSFKEPEGLGAPVPRRASVGLVSFYTANPTSESQTHLAPSYPILSSRTDAMSDLEKKTKFYTPSSHRHSETVLSIMPEFEKRHFQLNSTENTHAHGSGNYQSNSSKCVLPNNLTPQGIASKITHFKQLSPSRISHVKNFSKHSYHDQNQVSKRVSESTGVTRLRNPSPRYDPNIECTEVADSNIKIHHDYSNRQSEKYSRKADRSSTTSKLTSDCYAYSDKSSVPASYYYETSGKDSSTRYCLPPEDYPYCHSGPNYNNHVKSNLESYLAYLGNHIPNKKKNQQYGQTRDASHEMAFQNAPDTMSARVYQRSTSPIQSNPNQMQTIDYKLNYPNDYEVKNITYPYQSSKHSRAYLKYGRVSVNCNSQENRNISPRRARNSEPYYHANDLENPTSYPVSQNRSENESEGGTYFNSYKYNKGTSEKYNTAQGKTINYDKYLDHKGMRFGYSPSRTT